MENSLTFEEELENKSYEIKKRIEWFVNGIGIHCISSRLFLGLTTERIVELYNVEMSFFRPHLYNTNLLV